MQPLVLGAILLFYFSPFTERQLVTESWLVTAFCLVIVEILSGENQQMYSAYSVRLRGFESLIKSYPSLKYTGDVSLLLKQ